MLKQLRKWSKGAPKGNFRRRLKRAWRWRSHPSQALACLGSGMSKAHPSDLKRVKGCGDSHLGDILFSDACLGRSMRDLADGAFRYIVGEGVDVACGSGPEAC